MIHVFIINSHAGKSKFSAGLRKYLSQNYPNLNYYIFHTRKALDERSLVKEILELFGNERIRIYCCGGSGTISNAIYGVEDFSNIEFAFYPKGFTNDFLKCFGKDEAYFHDISNLIEGRVIQVDYIKTNHGNSLNSFSIGLDSEQLTKMDHFRDISVIGSNAPYIMGFIFAVFFSRPEELEITIDDTVINGRTSELFFGNGGVIGGKLWFDTKPSFNDGLGRIVVFNTLKPFTMIKTLLALSNKEKLKPELVRYDGYAKKVSVKKSDGSSFIMNFDGELQNQQVEWNAEIIKQGLSFVLPKGVEL